MTARAAERTLRRRDGECWRLSVMGFLESCSCLGGEKGLAVLVERIADDRRLRLVRFRRSRVAVFERIGRAEDLRIRDGERDREDITIVQELVPLHQVHVRRAESAT